LLPISLEIPDRSDIFASVHCFGARW